MAKFVTVFGAHGILGAAVAKCLAKDNLLVKAVDPDGHGQYSVDLKSCGVQIVTCDLDNPNNIKDVISGSEAVFVHTVSDLKNPNSEEDEKRQGINIANACKDIKHVVFCTELNPLKIIGVAARHLSAKAEIEEHMRFKVGLEMTSLMVPPLYEDIMGIMKPENAGMNDRWLVIPMGTTPLDMICADDVGEIVRVIINNRSAHINRTHSVSGDKITIKEMAHYLSKHLRPLCFRDKQVTIHEYQEMYSPRPWAQDYANMFDFFLRVDQRYNVDATRRIIPKLTLTGFEEWVAKNSQKLCYAFS